jgi:SAM-dependent methyltransferase
MSTIRNLAPSVMLNLLNTTANPVYRNQDRRPQPLAIQEAEEWALLLQSFDSHEYRSKADEFLPSMASIIEGLPVNNGKLLDAGCGSGLAGRLAQQYGWSVTGADILPAATRMASEHFPCECADVQQMPFPSGAFDAVICSMVLMLVEDVNRACVEMSRVLRPGGVLLIALANPYERTVRAPTNGPALRPWRFHLPTRSVSIHYIWRQLSAYTSALARAAANPTLHAVSRNAALVPVADCRPHVDSEYIWLQAVKPRVEA